MTKLESRNPSQEEMKIISNKSFGEERALYNSSNLLLTNVKFEGEEDGESALKESSDIVIEDSRFDLRYPLWHVERAIILNSEFTEKCRAAFWYDKDIDLSNCKINGVKIFRECKDVVVRATDLVSEEPFWRVKGLYISDSSIEGVYAFFESKNIKLTNVKFKGKYSFQYVKNLHIKDSVLDTKDAFWHAENVICENSTIKGEYLGWYSKNVTFINCTIESHQPLCYASNIKLINCKMPNSDLAFEYTSVKGNIIGKINSIKNPKSGKLVIDELGEFIKEDSKYKSTAKVIVKTK